MDLNSRREKEKSERRESILDAAEEIFFSKGYERCSMDEIARTAQLSRALLYVYFKDKAAMLHAILLRSARRLRDRFESALEDQQQGIDQIASIARAYYDFSQRDTHYFDVLTQSSTFVHLACDTEQNQALHQCGAEIMQLMVDALEAGLADGSISAERVTDPLQTAYFLRGALHGVIMEVRHAERRAVELPEAERLIGYTIEMLGHSLRG
ncbi:TetR/AcrR family transcriptional regulator [Pseudomonas saliphila]|uniref:TetR/AcrR family transcriptional regulator n=1 Tax=Pseudomonas saliphila TaxID=2586906 RepID=UPI00123B1CF5|nr:TetR/AcrR family transcriptional regulator [Pseudomonas saliphila]